MAPRAKGGAEAPPPNTMKTKAGIWKPTPTAKPVFVHFSCPSIFRTGLGDCFLYYGTQATYL